MGYVEIQFEEDLLEYFMPMLHDKERNNLYEKAINAVIKQFISTHGYAPRVLDVGAGTGVLSVFAANAGASHVVGIEANKIRARLAQKNVNSQTLPCRVEIINCKSIDYKSKIPFDIVVSELIATLVHAEEMTRFLSDLIQRNVVKKFEHSVYSVPLHMEMWLQPFKTTINNQGTTFFRAEMIKSGTGQFEMGSEYGIFPHTDSLAESGSPIHLINQATWTPLIKNTVEITMEKKSCLVAEWRCCLYGDIYLEHTVQSVSRLSPFQYHMRMKSWGFEVYATDKAKNIRVEVTDDDLAILPNRKRKRD